MKRDKYKQNDITFPHRANAKKGVNENDIIATKKNVYKNILTYLEFIIIQPLPKIQYPVLNLFRNMKEIS
jgi:hypothetical protein